MPTGYTARLCEGPQTFQEFALGCARAFGALVTMHDEPSAAPIPDELKPSDYHDKALAKARSEVIRLRSMSIEQEIEFGLSLKNAKIASWREAWACWSELDGRLVDMIAKVQAWSASPNHAALKDFMIQQLTVSRYEAPSEQSLADMQDERPFSYFCERLLDELRNIEYHAAQAAEEKECTAQRNLWLKQLRESLK